jgi:hypothetical protein
MDSNVLRRILLGQHGVLRKWQQIITFIFAFIGGLFVLTQLVLLFLPERALR